MCSRFDSAAYMHTLFLLSLAFIAAGPLVSSARLLELTHVHMVLVALRVSRVPVSFSVSLTFFSHGFQIYGHRARTFLSSLLAFGSCMHLLSRLKLSFLFLLAAHSCTLLFSTGFFFLFFFVFFRMYFHYCPVFFVPWRDLGRVGVNDEQQQQYTIRYHSPTSWTPCFYAFR